MVEPKKIEPIKFAGKVKVIVCTRCRMIQEQANAEKEGHCMAEKLSKGWQRCDNNEFWEI